VIGKPGYDEGRRVLVTGDAQGTEYLHPLAFTRCAKLANSTGEKKRQGDNDVDYAARWMLHRNQGMV